MRRETRFNLIFLIVFILVALPGAVILFRKKMDPTAHRLDQPDPVLHRLPYMVPPPAPPDIKWIVPDKTQAWVESLTAPAPTLSSGPPGPQWEPVISPDHLLQVLSVAPAPVETAIVLLFWTDMGAGSPAPELFSVTVDKTGKARVAEVKSVELPREVRRELVMGGFVRPPQSVMVLTVVVQGLPESGAHRIELTYRGTDPPIRTSVQLKVRGKNP